MCEDLTWIGCVMQRFQGISESLMDWPEWTCDSWSMEMDGWNSL